jgi:hypothetical protein
LRPLKAACVFPSSNAENTQKRSPHGKRGLKSTTIGDLLKTHRGAIDQQYAAKAILRKVKAQPELPPFHYIDQGSLAVIGRWTAVANAFGVHLSGLLAWIVLWPLHS